MSFTDGITINRNHSYKLHGLQIKSRNIGLPEKKSIRQAVPFMNGYYDFTTLNGQPAWGERIIEFTFDILEDTPQLLESKIANVLRWFANTHDEDIYDDVINTYHWHGSYESSEVNYDESGLQAELKVSFVVYPFKIKNSMTNFALTESEGTKTIINYGMPVPLYLTALGEGTLTIGGQTITYNGSEKRKKIDYFLPHPSAVASVTGGAVVLEYTEEAI